MSFACAVAAPPASPALTSEPSRVDSAAFEVLHYNQSLVQFADSKAGNLIVINSLFIAAAQAGGASFLLLKLLQASLVLCAGVALLLCLAVIMSQGGLPRLPGRDGIFFGDITHRKMDAYVRDFQATPDHAGDALRRTYVVALIARRKFACYGWAQWLTAGAAVLWLIHSLATALLR